jgi:hypothetical protein
VIDVKKALPPFFAKLFSAKTLAGCNLLRVLFNSLIILPRKSFKASVKATELIKMYYFVARVTRLGDFGPIGRLFSLCSFF